MYDSLQATFNRLLQEVSTTTYRYLYHKFNINSRLTGLIGPRGVGKTTLMLQYIREHFLEKNKPSAFYFSADHIIFNQSTLLELIEFFYQHEDIRIFFIDEIHKYKNWQQELKNIYDAYPNIKIVFSGSSSIDLIHGSFDLSRRARLYYLHGLSFREFINFKTDQVIPAISLQDLLENPTQFNMTLSKIPKIQGYFKEYLQFGYYPFYFEDPETYYEKITRVIEKTIYEDIASFYSLKTENLYLFKKILNFLASVPPSNINTHNLAKNLGIDSKTAAHYLLILSQVGLVRLIYAHVGGNTGLSKPEKVFIDNTTLLYAINDALNTQVEIGTIRELCFVQFLLNAGKKVFYTKMGDFQVDKKIFEIGGKNKTWQQLKKLNDHQREISFLIKDEIEVGGKNIIPLYFLGFLY